MAEIPARKPVCPPSSSFRSCSQYLALGIALGAPSLAGCGSGAVTAGTPGVTSGALTISGQVLGGQQPVNLSTISLYAAGKTALASISSIFLALLGGALGNLGWRAPFAA